MIKFEANLDNEAIGPGLMIALKVGVYYSFSLAPVGVREHIKETISVHTAITQTWF
jgi:predicted N-acetyltransferase YhbS